METTNNPLHFGIIQHFSSFRPSVPDFCKLPAIPGPCRAYIPSFYFDANEGVCKEFVYGGCNGNQNRFINAEVCMDECKPSNNPPSIPSIPVRPSVPDFCKLPAIAGPCRAYIPSFYFDANEGVCKEFVYGGCNGNQNRFINAEMCMDECKPSNNTPSNPSIPVRPSVPDFCKLPAIPGPCRAYIPSFYFDANEGVCKEFVYGGCNGNQNRFINAEVCMDECKPSNNPPSIPSIPVRPSVPDFCKLPAIPGPCRAYIPSFYFDANEGVCKEFVYGGCNGNQNRFINAEVCMDECKPSNNTPSNPSIPVRPSVPDFCKLPAIPGPCRAYIPSFYFDANEGVCKEFVYGGCNGNQNRFINAEMCMDECKPSNNPPSNPSFPGHTKVRKDTKRHEKTRKDAKRREKTRKDAKRHEKTQKDTKRYPRGHNTMLIDTNKSRSR